MSYAEEARIKYADSHAVDAFGRLRVASPQLVFESKQLNDERPLLWVTRTVGSSTSIHSGSRASTILSVDPTSGSHVIRQSRVRLNYEPGRSHFIACTGIFGPSQADVKKRIGYFDARNGMFFEDNGESRGVVVRSAVSGSGNIISTFVSQSEWNVDQMDGTGPSGYTLNWNNAQIFTIDFQWLGVGRIRYGVEISGSIVPVHNICNSNCNDSVYMSSPNLPVRYEIECDGAGATSTGSLEQICAVVLSEGGQENVKFQFAADRGIAPLQNVSASAPAPLISIRLNPNHLTAFVTPTSINVLSTLKGATNDFRWLLVINPSIGGTDNATWQNIPGSAVQYDITRDVTNFLSGGTIVGSGYGNGDTAPALEISGETATTLGATVDGVPDELVLAVQRTTSSADFYGSIGWKEEQ